MIAPKWGPGIGGLFLAFPAIFPASDTLIEKHERRRKQKKGLQGAQPAPMPPLSTHWVPQWGCRPRGLRRHLLVARSALPNAIGARLRDPCLVARIVFRLGHSTTSPAVILKSLSGQAWTVAPL